MVEHVETAARAVELGPLSPAVVTQVWTTIRQMPPIKPSTVDAPKTRTVRAVVGAALERVPGGRTLKRKLAGR